VSQISSLSAINTSLLFNFNPLPCLLVSASSFRILSANKAATDLFNMPEAVLQSMLLMDFATEAGKLDLMYHLSNGKAGQSWNLQISLHRPEAIIANKEMYGQSFECEGSLVHQIVIVDISEKVKSEKHAGEGANRYRDFMDQTTEGIFLYEFDVPVSIELSDEDYLQQFEQYCILSEGNDALAKMYGYENATSLKGLKASMFVNFSDPINIAFFKAFRNNNYQLTDAETLEIDRFGQQKFFSNNLTGVIENGFLVRAWGCQRDITEKKQAEKRAHLLAKLVEGTSDILTLADANYNPMTWNKAAENIYGLTAEQVIGKNLRELIDISYHNVTREEVRAIIEKEGEWRGEMSFKRPTDGKKVVLLTSFKILKDDHEHFLGYLVSGTDISQIKETEFKLQESESRFREVADNAPVLIWMTNEVNKTTYANKPLLDFIGLGLEAFLAADWESFVHPEDVPIAIHRFNQFFEARKPVTLIYRLKNKYGKYRWVQDSSIPRFLTNKTFLGFIGSIIDIHDTKEKEEQFRYQATVLENVLDSVITTDLQLNVKTWNKISEQFFGINEKEAIGKRFDELIQFDFSHYHYTDVMEQLKLQGMWKGEVKYINKWGEVKYFVYTLAYVYNEEGYRISIMSVLRDVTERKRAEEKLKESEVFYRSLIADSLDGMVLANEQGIIKFASPSVKHSLGYEAEDLLFKNIFNFVHPDDREEAIRSFQQEINENQEVRFITIRLLKKDGQWLWCMVRGHNLLHNPYVNSVVIYFHDDTMRKEATAALQESEQRFRKLIHDLKVGVLLQDASGQVITANKIILETLQITEEELLGKKMVEEIRDAIKENGQLFKNEERPLNIVLRTKQPVYGVVMGLVIPKFKERIWVMLNLHPILDADDNILHIITSFVDITERKKLEQQIWQEQIKHQRQLTQATIDGQEKERREIGKELHDNIGQQLTTMKLYLDMAKSCANSEAEVMISQALKGISGLINEVRSISRSLMPPTLGDLGLVDSINDLIETINRTQAFVIHFNYESFNEDPIPENMKLMLFRILQEQLNNIVKHAKAKRVVVTLYQDDNAIQLNVMDDGVGFEMNNIRRGLGLKNMKNRAELFGGHVQITSAAGNGCILKVTIPAGQHEPLQLK